MEIVSFSCDKLQNIVFIEYFVNGVPDSHLVGALFLKRQFIISQSSKKLALFDKSIHLGSTLYDFSFIQFLSLVSLGVRNQQLNKRLLGIDGLKGIYAPVLLSHLHDLVLL
jgi:hypothetical protein